MRSFVIFTQLNAALTQTKLTSAKRYASFINI